MTSPFSTTPVTPNAPFRQVGPPMAANPFGATSPQELAFMNAAMANPDLVGVIQGLGSGAWDAIKGVLPKNADGSVDWGKVGSDVAGWVRNNTGTILSIASAVNDHARQQQSDTYAKEGLKLATDEYNDLNPDGTPAAPGKKALRLAGAAGMLNPNANTPDLSNLQTLAGPKSGNPFTTALPLAQLNSHKVQNALPLAPSPSPTPPQLTGFPNLPALPPPGQQTGTPPTIPVGMKPPPGWVPPKALPLATPGAPTVDPNPTKLQYGP